MALLDTEGKDSRTPDDHVATDSARKILTATLRPGPQPHNAGITPGWARNAAGECIRTDSGHDRRARLRRALNEVADILTEIADERRGGAA